jgi:hypothetical protein
MEKTDIVSYFEGVAACYAHNMRRNLYYHRQICHFFVSSVPPGARVLEIGSITGDTLAALRPSRGVGLCFHDQFTKDASQAHPEIEFRTCPIDAITLPQDFEPDYIIIVNSLEFVYDLWDFFNSIRSAIHKDIPILITTTNPLWKPILSVASALGLRTPSLPVSFLTNRDILSVMQLQGFELVRYGMLVAVPKYVPLLSAFFNMIVPEVPAIRQLCSTQFLIARLARRPRSMSCTVVIPAHNEEGNIEECIRRVPNMGASTEIIVVDDGSQDATAAIVREAALSDKRVRLISYHPNRGKNNAVQTGFHAATGEVLMILDADMTVMPEDLPKFLAAMEEGRADFVNGTRLIYPRANRSMKFTNLLGNKMFCLLISWIISQRVSDTLCGTKVLFKKDFLNIPMGSEKWGDFDLIFGAANLGLRILEIPVHYKERMAGVSKMKAFKELFIFLQACWKGLLWLKLSRRGLARSAG